MDHNNPEPVKADVRAQRVRMFIVILTVVLIAAPFVAYLLAGRGAAPGQ